MIPNLADAFFNEPEEQSLVKAEIVVGYFVAWSRIMASRSRADRIGYFDFYAGPGRYGTGQKSTPLLILERAIGSSHLPSRLVARFNDANPKYARALDQEIASLPGVERLKHKPKVHIGEVDDELARRFESIRTIPALSFIDPWGYKGLSLDLIHAVVKDWGCEVVFFFNYNRINMGIGNPVVRHHMEALFGEERLAALRTKVESLDPAERESVVHDAIKDALGEMGAPFVLPFKFRGSDGRLSHSICFVSKNPLGYGIMKDIMAGRGLVDEDGVPMFEHTLSAGTQLRLGQERPLLALPGDLLKTFAGQTLTVGEIFESHNVGTDFIRRNYKDVVIRLEESGIVSCWPDIHSRREGTCADHVAVTFPA